MTYKKIRVFAYSNNENVAQAFARAIGDSVLTFFKSFSNGLKIEAREIKNGRVKYRAEVELFFNEKQFVYMPDIQDTLRLAAEYLRKIEPAIVMTGVYDEPTTEEEIATMKREAVAQRQDRTPKVLRDALTSLSEAGFNVEAVVLN